jgi:hypothetical protein
MHKNATKCNKTLSKWCKNKHGASKIMDTLETYQRRSLPRARKPLRRRMKRKAKMEIQVKRKMKRMGTTMSDLLVFSPFLAS